MGLDRTVWICNPCEEERERRQTTQNTETAGNTSAGSTQFRTAKATERSIKILQLNVDSITSKMEELKGFIKQHEIDIFLLQETKLVKNDETPRFPGFAVERKNREQPPGEEDNRGGGLMMGI